MKPDELHALADALEPMAKAPRFEDFDVPAFCAYLRAQADAEPVGYVTANGLRMLKQDDATVLLYAHDYLIRPDCVALYTHPVPQPQPEKCGCRSCLTPAERLCTFVVCPECGDKRCPRADDHRNDCTSDNVPQPQPEPMPKGKPGFVQQIENSRENVKAWPQWMQDATVESAATMPKFPTPQPERQPGSEPTEAQSTIAERRLRHALDGLDHGIVANDVREVLDELAVLRAALAAREPK